MLGIVSSLLPPAVRTFGVTEPDTHVHRYARQPMDSWQFVPPPKTGERCRRDGIALAITMHDREPPIDLSMLFGLGPDDEWQALDRVTVANTLVTITRREDGVDLLLSSQQQA